MRPPTEAQLRATPMALLINRHCGHVLSAVSPGALGHLENLHATLVVLGFTGWQIETRPATDAELEGLIAGTRCHRCQID